MDTNLYAPPVAAVQELPPPAAVAAPFFVVARWKFVLLYAATMGLYEFYWLYMQWARFRRRTGEPMWPVARAIFPIFFAHSLNREIEHRLRRIGPHGWAPGALATLYVVCTLGSTVADRLSWNDIGSPYSELASLALLLPTGYSLARTQSAANVASGDPCALANNRLTWANWAWMGIGLLVWAVVLLGIGLIVTGEA